MVVKKATDNGVLALLEQYVEEAKKGTLVSIGIVGLRADGTCTSAFSASDNLVFDAGMLLLLALRRLGVQGV